MPCTTQGCHLIYQGLGSSIYSNKCNISNTQRLFTTNLPAYHHLDLSTRRNKGKSNCPNRCKGERKNKQQLSHQDILNIKLSQSYNDPKSFRRRK